MSPLTTMAAAFSRWSTPLAAAKYVVRLSSALGGWLVVVVVVAVVAVVVELEPLPFGLVAGVLVHDMHTSPASTIVTTLLRTTGSPPMWDWASPSIVRRRSLHRAGPEVPPKLGLTRSVPVSRWSRPPGPIPKGHFVATGFVTVDLLGHSWVEPVDAQSHRSCAA